ncbi:MAG TPA: hypothetical protein VGR72_05915 [Candidatus Acidoferrales bacterium]|nr:hypothetical protein [Candidatus Acidoferrales bacterium]
MIENTATYDFLIENENHLRIALKKRDSQARAEMPRKTSAL